ncbi:peptidoglycan editing factor PgeF [Pseudoalteromonas sp. SMS1]|nr:peptidoglycan editing factor PgeF [Pseudoalteromonas sp. SMS1]MCF2856326.1 peptidoglycan editing factor PgeF [Pseudoalteromonas sp. SMS1]
MFLPSWPIQSQIGAVSSTRLGGHSKAPFDAFNLAYHVGDNSEAVTKNRMMLNSYLPDEPVWLEQVHGSDVLVVNQHTDMSEVVRADALYTDLRCKPLAIMTADCLPILLASKHADEVAALHGGWRPLAAGIVANTLKHFKTTPSDIVAWFGPAIGPKEFEVGVQVYTAFVTQNPAFSQAFVSTSKDKFLANIFLLAKLQLNLLGVTEIYSDNVCTVTQHERFFSYRRDGQCGRMATVIWRK